MKKYAFSLILTYFAVLVFSFAQTPFVQSDGLCKSGGSSLLSLKKMPWYGNNNFLYNILDDKQYFTTQYNFENALYRIPITFWVYRKRDGSMGAEEKEIKAMMQNLNKYNILNNTGFVYYMNPEIQYINNNKRVKFGYFIEKPAMTLLHKKKGCINVHVTRNIVMKRMFKNNKAIRGTYNKITKGISIRKVSSTTTLAHEIGHFFGLYHPHRNYNKGKCKQEAVNRDRKFKGCFKHGLICEKSGDALCDTPAEPMLAGIVNKDCVYEGTNKDNWGDAYVPSTNNIMSYPTSLACRKEFSPGQVAVMLHTANKKSENGWKGNNQQYKFDSYEPNNTAAMAGDLFAEKKQLHTMHKLYVNAKKDLDNDEDWFRFELQKKNSKVTITTYKGNNSDTDTEIFLYNSDNKLIASDNDGGGKGYSKLMRQKMNEGTYYVKVIKKNTITTNTICDYNILLSKK